MAFSPISGKLGQVAIGSVLYAFDKWENDGTMNLPDVSNFTGSGVVQRTTGLADTKVTLTGPYDTGNMAFTIGSAYTLLLGWNNSITITISGCILQSIKSSQDVKDAGRVSLVFAANGSVDLSIV